MPFSFASRSSFGTQALDTHHSIVVRLMGSFSFDLIFLLPGLVGSNCPRKWHPCFAILVQFVLSFYFFRKMTFVVSDFCYSYLKSCSPPTSPFAPSIWPPASRPQPSTTASGPHLFSLAQLSSFWWTERSLSYPCIYSSRIIWSHLGDYWRPFASWKPLAS